LTRIVDRAKREGAVRADFEQSDLVFIQLAVSATMARSRAVAPDLYRRYLAMFLDGIRTSGGPTTLPFAALDADQTHAAMTSGQ
jgi:hypothetical protein